MYDRPLCQRVSQSSKTVEKTDKQIFMPEVAEAKTPQKCSDAALDEGSSEKGPMPKPESESQGQKTMPALGSIDPANDMAVADMW